MEVDGGAVDLGRLQERFSLEYTNLYVKVADVARQQSNYSVCCKYLGLTEKAINEVCTIVGVFSLHNVHDAYCKFFSVLFA